MSPSGRPREEPIGILIARVGKQVERAFDDALSAAGGSRSNWLVLLSVKSGVGRTQAAIAERMGISGPTLTHHLDRLEADGLVTRTREASNRRVQVITLTEAGDALFFTLRAAAMGFDQQLHAAVDATDLHGLRRQLEAIQHALTQTHDHPAEQKE
jgi:MarR family transcriptional regulator, transcriptional regulator for hemolysin